MRKIILALSVLLSLTASAFAYDFEIKFSSINNKGAFQSEVVSVPGGETVRGEIVSTSNVFYPSTAIQYDFYNNDNNFSSSDPSSVLYVKLISNGSVVEIEARNEQLIRLNGVYVHIKRVE